MEKLVGAIIGIVLLLAVVGIIDATTGPTMDVDGVVVDRQYTPRSTSTGTVTDSKGRVSTATNTTSEKWKVIAQTAEWTGAADATPSIYAQAEPRRAVRVQLKLGRWSKRVCGASVVQVAQ